MQFLNILGINYLPTEDTKILEGDAMAHRTALFHAIDGAEKVKIPVRITPELAKLFLERNTSNIRAMNRKRVKEDLVPAITAGDWEPLNAHIAFDEQGLLKNGQHTCQAVVDAGLPIVAWVETGITKRREMVIDNCSPRRAHHAIEGMDNYGQAALKAMLEQGVLGNVDTNAHAMARHWEKFGTHVSSVLNILGKFSDGKRPPGTAQLHGAFVAALCNGITESDLARFAEEAFGTNTTWLQAANMVRSLGSHCKGYSAKDKRRQYAMTLMVLKNYLTNDQTTSAPSVKDADRYPALAEWPVKI